MSLFTNEGLNNLVNDVLGKWRPCFCANLSRVFRLHILRPQLELGHDSSRDLLPQLPDRVGVVDGEPGPGPTPALPAGLAPRLCSQLDAGHCGRAQGRLCGLWDDCLQSITGQSYVAHKYMSLYSKLLFPALGHQNNADYFVKDEAVDWATKRMRLYDQGRYRYSDY